jgi:hypothetical protein
MTLLFKPTLIFFFIIVFNGNAQTALVFNGTNSYVEVPYISANNPSQFTVECWARVDGGSGHRSPLTSRGNAIGYLFYANPSGIWQFWSGTGGTWLQLSGTPVVVGQWTHLAATYDGTTFRFYVNGILVNSQIGSFRQNLSHPLRIGAGRTENPSPQFYFNGAVDEVRIWNIVRSLTQINDTKSINITVPESGLVSYYQFEDGTATNKTGAANGTLYNTPTQTTGVSLAPGKPLPTITNFNPYTKTYFDGSFTIINPTSNSTGAFSYASDNAAVAAISGNTVTITGVGTANITATQAAEATYSSGTATVSLTISDINMVLKNGGISNTNPNYVDQHGRIGGANALSKNGALLQTRSPVLPFSGGTFDGFTYNLVTSATTRVWLDRNLGASQVATSSSDALSFGDLYQWGRGTDGHEKRTSTNINMVSTTDTPGHSFFINANSFNWQSPVNTNLWQGVNGTNNPCPNGFRVPTIEELEAERNLWGSQNAAGAIASSLKLPLAGRRHTNGQIYSVGSNGMYRTTTSLILNITSTTAARAGDERIDGFCVRCIKD